MEIKSLGIVGGGISGLALLHYLKSRNLPADITLYERQTRLGGNIQSRMDQGFLFETGPNGFFETETTRQLVEDLQLTDQLAVSNSVSRQRFIQHRGHLHRVPMAPSDFVGTPLLRPPEKIRALWGLLKKLDQGNLSIDAYVQQRFGRGVADKMADPFISGVFAGDTKRLHMKSSFPKMGKRGGLMSFKGGMGQLIARLGDRYAKHIQMGQEVVSLKSLESKHSHIFCTAPAYAAAALTGFESLKKIVYAPVAVVGCGFAIDALVQRPQGYGYLIPSGEGKQVLGVLIESNCYEGRAPQEHIMVRVMIGGRRHPQSVEASDSELISMALSELTETFAVTRAPLKTWVQKWPRAIPQYELGYPGICQELKQELAAHPRWGLSGNYLGGIGLNDCVLNAKAIADSFSLC